MSDDNPFIEALFRTVKYRPNFPDKPFESIEAARTWLASFVAWYNEEHLHSGIAFVTPRRDTPASRRNSSRTASASTRQRRPRTRSAGHVTLELGIGTPPFDSTHDWRRPPNSNLTTVQEFSRGNYLEIHRRRRARGRDMIVAWVVLFSSRVPGSL